MEDSLGATPPNIRIPPSACSAELPGNLWVPLLGTNDNAVCEHAAFAMVLNGVAF
jgi:hypothetical protein